MLLNFNMRSEEMEMRLALALSQVIPVFLAFLVYGMVPPDTDYFLTYGAVGMAVILGVTSEIALVIRAFDIDLRARYFLKPIDRWGMYTGY